MATETDADRAKREAKEKAEQERKAKAEKAEADRKAKAEAKAAEKAAKAKEAAEAKAKREEEAITKILADGDVKRDDVKGTGENGAITRSDARDAVKAKKAEERANRPKKASLTLSQRRALLNLRDAGKNGIVPKTGFNALPLEYLTSVKLAEAFKTQADVTSTKTVEKEVEIPEAERKEGGPTTKTVKEKVEETNKVDATGYRLTEAGVARAEEVNPKWQNWKPDGSGSTTEETAAAS